MSYEDQAYGGEGEGYQPASPASVRGIPRNERPKRQERDRWLPQDHPLRVRYTGDEELKQLDQSHAGEWQGVCHFAKISDKNGKRRLGLAFGVETPQGPRSWYFSVGIDSSPAWFWETVEAILGDTGSEDIIASMFLERYATVIVGESPGYMDGWSVLRVREPQPTQQAPAPHAPSDQVAPGPQQGQVPQQAQAPSAGTVPAAGYGRTYGAPQENPGQYRGAPPPQHDYRSQDAPF